MVIGTPREDVAARFPVSVPTIERWLRLKRETGGLAPKPVPGPPAVKTTALMAALPERLAEQRMRRWRSSAPGGGRRPGSR